MRIFSFFYFNLTFQYVSHLSGLLLLPAHDQMRTRVLLPLHPAPLRGKQLNEKLSHVRRNNAPKPSKSRQI